MDNKTTELLRALENSLKGEEGIGELSIFTAEELGAPMDILRVEISGFGVDFVSVLGEFFFMPFEETDILYFTSVITITGTLEKDAVPDMTEAVSRMNYYLPFGCFAIGEEDKNLIYKYTVPVMSENDEEKKKFIAGACDSAIGMAENFEGYLKLILRNEMSVEEVLEMFKNGRR
ncbi:MAG: YbjN domain-containing protein [Lachnospiraceae bacterium]|nr:YbjN domain-containing protein [Lachnospiraceae bacterium]